MKFKTLYLVITLLSIHFAIFSQTKEQYAKAKVDYNISIKLDKDNKRYKLLEKYFPDSADKIEAIDSEFDFALILNDSISVFYLENKFFSDARIAELALIHSGGYYGRIRQQPQNYITEELQEDFGKFLVSRPYQEWELHDDTKTIGDYTCFKATTFYTTTNPEGKVFKHDFTAWYTPELPYSYGPAGYGNLPGLIIELQGKEFTYGVNKIKFFDKGEESKETKMPELKKKKLITEEEFERLAAEDEKRWMQQN